MGLVQSVKERALGEPNCSLMVSIRKLSGRWRQAAHGDEMRTNSRHKSNQERFRLDIRKKLPSMRTTEQWIWLHNQVVCCFQPRKFSGPDWPKSSVTWSDLTAHATLWSAALILREMTPWSPLQPELSYYHFYFNLVQTNRLNIYWSVHLLSVI